MGNYSPKRYELWKTLFKALQTAIAANLAIELVRLDLPTTVEEWKARGAQLAVTLAMAVGRGVWNMWKTREVPGNPFYNLVTPWMLALVLIPFLSGCVSMTRALAGKTFMETDYYNENKTAVNPDGEIVPAGDVTHYTSTIKAPAGVDAAKIASMNMKWNADGSGTIGVADDSGADTTAQAAALVEVNAEQAAAFRAIVAVLPSLLPLLTGLPAGGGEVETAPTPFALPEGVDVNALWELLQGLRK